MFWTNSEPKQTPKKCYKFVHKNSSHWTNPKLNASKEFNHTFFDAEVLHEEMPEELLVKLWKQQNEALLNILKGK